MASPDSRAPAAVVVTKLSPADHDYPALLAQSLQALGWQVTVLPAEQLRNDEAFVDEFRALWNRAGASVLFSVNFRGMLAWLSLQLGLRYVFLMEVYPLDFDFPELPPHNDVWCFESCRDNARRWRQGNFHAQFHPLGFDHRLFAPRPLPCDIDVSFVGNGLGEAQRLLQGLSAAIAGEARGDGVDPLRVRAYAAVQTFLEQVLGLSYGDFVRGGASVEQMIDRYCDSLRSLEPEIVEGIRRTLLGRASLIKVLLARRQRIETLARLSTVGQLRVFGRDWGGTPIEPCVEPPVPFGQAAEVYGRSRVTLDIQRFYASNINDRLFNVPASGGLLLVNSSAGAEEFFDPGREIDTYGDLDELESKTRYYLAHPGQRERMARAATRRAHLQYRFDQRLWEILGACDLPRPSRPPRAVAATP